MTDNHDDENSLIAQRREKLDALRAAAAQAGGTAYPNDFKRDALLMTDLAKNIAEQLRTKGKVTRGWLGVQIQDFTPELASSMNLKDTKGAIVAEVVHPQRAHVEHHVGRVVGVRVVHLVEQLLLHRHQGDGAAAADDLRDHRAAVGFHLRDREGHALVLPDRPIENNALAGVGARVGRVAPAEAVVIVVAHRQPHAGRIAVVQHDLDARGSRVLGDVGQPFLSDAISWSTACCH